MDEDADAEAEADDEGKLVDMEGGHCAFDADELLDKLRCLRMYALRAVSKRSSLRWKSILLLSPGDLEKRPQ